MTTEILHGDCIEQMTLLIERGVMVDSIVTDPPAGIAFMGKEWDHHKGGRDQWIAWMEGVAAKALVLAKPGAHALVWALPKTSHWTVTAWENAGWEVRDRVSHLFGSGFPKSHDISKAIDKFDATELRRNRQLKFTAWLRETGLTSLRINEITGTNMGGHYTTQASQPAVATRDIFEMLRPHLGCSVPDWVEQMVDERTVESENFKRRAVIGEHPNPAGNKAGGNSYNMSVVGMPETTMLTTPATSAAQQWEGWGTALKPAMEDWWLLRKPLSEKTVAANVLKHGTGGMNIDACRVKFSSDSERHAVAAGMARMAKSRMSDPTPTHEGWDRPWQHDGGQKSRMERNSEITKESIGRFPSHLIHDGSEEVMDAFAQFGERKNGGQNATSPQNINNAAYGGGRKIGDPTRFSGDSGTAARFFYAAKASKTDRFNSKHPTIKSIALLRYLCKLITPPGGVVLDPFAGSGTTLAAAHTEGFDSIGIEKEDEYIEDIKRRVASYEKALAIELLL